MKTYIKIALGVVLILAVAGIGTGLYLFNLKPRNLSKARPDFTITAADIQKAFEDNESAATAKYVGKVVEVTGEISAVKPGENNSVSISMRTSNEMSSVICTFPASNKPAGLNPGQTGVINGVCSGFLMDVLLNNCAIAVK
ncbi:MAG TPA: hypothetical protein VMT63_09320 [Bacteroidales bacterium]|nr:hypothetical protein [Bacteroidales bacterium]